MHMYTYIHVVYYTYIRICRETDRGSRSSAVFFDGRNCQFSWLLSDISSGLPLSPSTKQNFPEGPARRMPGPVAILRLILHFSIMIHVLWVYLKT